MAQPSGAPAGARHSWFEDCQAMLFGTLLVATGIHFYTQAGLLTGGTAGAAFLLQYLSGQAFGWWFFVINLPFYWFAWRRMGWRFTLRTFLAISLISLFSRLVPQALAFSHLIPAFAALIGGCLMGVGCLMLFRHGASLGGFNIAALYAQDQLGISAGKVLLALDLMVMGCAYFVVAPDKLLLSVAGTVIMNLIITFNHRSGRYLAFS